ncbi:MAG TPA: hypothetical protein VFQ54_12545, partial [Thermomicrobiales bacterium]|nr:hypothetical protein [Thermomicrobiales bacterium]
VWDAGTTKLDIVNDLLAALNYRSLWVDMTGQFQATPYVVPANRPPAYDLLPGIVKEFIDGPTSIYLDAWSRDRDIYGVPNKVIAIQSSDGDTDPLVGQWTNEDPDSPFSYPSRGRWITTVLTGVQTPDFSGEDDPAAATVAFLDAVAQRSGIAASSTQSTIALKTIPVPVQLLDVVRFANDPAGIDGPYSITSLKLNAYATGLLEPSLQEVLAL